jgi:hypothetical protein
MKKNVNEPGRDKSEGVDKREKGDPGLLTASPNCK